MDSEDKIYKKARIEFLEPMEIAHKYSLYFHNILNIFNTLPPSIEPIASGHILEQIDIIQLLIAKGIAYKINGSVYFDVKFYSKYGIFSKMFKIENLLYNRMQNKYKIEKKNPQDFALWKNSSYKHIMKWSSPWGYGFPGWHIECTAMSIKYLGDIFDIHGGGIDLKFPHHECEIAQLKSIFNKNIVSFWMHTNILTLNGNKMSKSTGNILLPNDIFNGKTFFFRKSFAPSVIRFFLLKSHYRSIVDIHNNVLNTAEIGYYRLIEGLNIIINIPNNNNHNISSFNVYFWRIKCYEAMNDDLNSPVLISYLFRGVQYIQYIRYGKELLSVSYFNMFKETMLTFILDILGLSIYPTFKDKIYLNLIQYLVNIMIIMRKEAIYDKKWNLADVIRKELLNIGVLHITNYEL
jgi:cysteinyl-tRNA synthetase